MIQLAYGHVPNKEKKTVLVQHGTGFVDTLLKTGHNRFDLRDVMKSEVVRTTLICWSGSIHYTRLSCLL